MLDVDLQQKQGRSRGATPGVRAPMSSEFRGEK